MDIWHTNPYMMILIAIILVDWFVSVNVNMYDLSYGFKPG